MSFSHPYVLALLIAPVLLLVWTWRHDGRRLALPLDHARVGRGRLLHALVALAESCGPLLLAVVILILAGPQRFGEPRSQRVLTNIEFCVDFSGSMTSSFGEGSRYDASMAAIDQFLNFRKGDAFGLTFFGNNVLHWAPLTQDPSAIRCAVPFMRPENAPPWFGGTAIAKAVMACQSVLTSRQEGDRMVVMVTDGYSYDLANGQDEVVARELQKENITVFIIHVAETEAPPQMGVIASITGGEVFSAGDPEGLKSVFKRIDAMKQTKLKKTMAETIDDFGPYCIAGLSTLGVLAATFLGLRYTPW